MASALAGVAIGVAWTALRHRPPPLVDRPHAAFGQARAVAFAREARREILAAEPAVSTGPFADMVRTVGERLAAAAGRPDFQWTFDVVADDDASAVCLPGGAVIVHAGLAAVADTPDRLAVVLGHVIAHAAAGDGTRRLARQLPAGTEADASAGFDVPTRRLLMGALGVGSRFGVLLPYSPRQEAAADRAGLLLLARACFDPSEAPRLWERAERAGGDVPLELLSLHPGGPRRAGTLARSMDAALALRRAQCGPAASE